ncbi:DUF6817 domain-containing protein [Streptomyces sp. NPDC053367]|uniref:DUF6817 domain-containing protein n=1 Tax=Streptomyces sp. NPDC053367 TaxID=3365700 RepID=UPI0037D269E5
MSSEPRAFLRRLGAESLAHPGGTLLAHLDRVRERLAGWGARPDLQLAGLCHACYGTDGFPAALLAPGRRTDLAAVIGTEAEAIVYAYGRCDRAGAYAALIEPGAPLRDRFTGRAFVPGPRLRRDLAELTAANELDLAWEDPEFRARWGPDLLELFTRLRPLLSRAAWEDCTAVLGDGVGAPAD